VVARANWKLGKSSTEKASLRSNNSLMTFDRSVKNNRYINESLVTILKRLAAGGFLKNNRQGIDYNWSRDPGFFSNYSFHEQPGESEFSVQSDADRRPSTIVPVMSHTH